MKKIPSMDAGIRLSAWAIAAACVFGAAAAHAQQAEPVRHLVRDGDTLYDLAQAYLEDPGQWQALSRENGNPNPLRLKPGSVIVVPDELLRKKPGGARVVHVSGGVRYTTRSGSTGALERDMRLIDGDRLSTDAGGFATLEMADGSVVRVAGDSELRLERLKYSLTKKRADTSLTLDKGRVESRVSPQRPTGSRFQVDTPLMAAGVRGTEFGVSMREGSAATSDVLEGEVELRVARSGSTARVAAGLGGAVAADAPTATLTPLLAAPELSGVQALQRRPVIDLAFPALAGAASYRAFIWPAHTAEQVAGNLVTATPRVRFAGLDDGDYVVRINGVDAQGIEGRPVTCRSSSRPGPNPRSPSPRPTAAWWSRPKPCSAGRERKAPSAIACRCRAIRPSPVPSSTKAGWPRILMRCAGSPRATISGAWARSSRARTASRTPGLTATRAASWCACR